VLPQVVPDSPSTGWLQPGKWADHRGLTGGFGWLPYGLSEPGSLRRTLEMRRPSLGPPGRGLPASMRRLGCSPQFDPGNRTVLSVQNLGPTAVSIRTPGGQDPRGGSTCSPSWRSATCLATDVVPTGRQGGAGLTRPAASTLDCRPGAPLVAATGVALGAFRRRGFIDDDSDAIPLRNPTRFRRLAGSRACVGDHLRPVTGGTYDSRCRRLGSPQVLPRGSGGDTGGARRNRQGAGGHSGRIGVRGPAARGAGQERGRPPP
jgi:hypothetical protein